MEDIEIQQRLNSAIRSFHALSNLQDHHTPQKLQCTVYDNKKTNPNLQCGKSDGEFWRRKHNMEISKLFGETNIVCVIETVY